MIDYLKGTITHIEHDYIVIEVSGIGYQVFCPQPASFSSQLDQSVQLFIHDHVREDAHLLYGFASREEQSFFRLLLEVSGIGPKVALGVLTGGSPTTAMIAIMQEDLSYLTQLPGIGKKTAQRIILDLKDKLSSWSAASASLPQFKNLGSQDAISHQSHWLDAKEALIAWGYTEVELQKVWGQLKDKVQENDAADLLIKKALQLLSKS